MRKAACLPSLCKIMDHTRMYARACTHTGCLRAFIHPLLNIPHKILSECPSPWCPLLLSVLHQDPQCKGSLCRDTVCVFLTAQASSSSHCRNGPMLSGWCWWRMVQKNHWCLSRGERCLLWFLLLCFPANYVYLTQFWLSSKRNQSLASLTTCSVTLCVPSHLKPYYTKHGIYFLLLFLCSTKDCRYKLHLGPIRCFAAYVNVLLF